MIMHLAVGLRSDGALLSFRVPVLLPRCSHSCRVLVVLQSCSHEPTLISRSVCLSVLDPCTLMYAYVCVCVW